MDLLGGDPIDQAFPDSAEPSQNAVEPSPENSDMCTPNGPSLVSETSNSENGGDVGASISAAPEDPTPYAGNEEDLSFAKEYAQDVALGGVDAALKTSVVGNAYQAAKTAIDVRDTINDPGLDVKEKIIVGTSQVATGVAIVAASTAVGVAVGGGTLFTGPAAVVLGVLAGAEVSTVLSFGAATGINRMKEEFYK